MKFDEVLTIVQDLGKSQGYYSRLYQQLKVSDESQKRYIERFTKDCKSALDLVLLLEQ